MLQIRLKRDPSAEGGPLKPSLPAETVTVACPDHLVLADLPVAKGLGAATSSSQLKTVGRKSRRQLGERVHFCVRCDFPIAIYGRLSPCDHVFCFDCSRSDSICYLCDERIQKIQTIRMMEGIFICAAPHCLKSFLKKSDFEAHISECHTDLLQPNADKDDGNESENRMFKQSTASESTARAPPRPVISPGSSQMYDREDRPRHQQAREHTPSRPVLQQKPPSYLGQVQNIPSENQTDNNRPPGFDRPGQLSEKQQGIMSETPFHDYPPLHSIQQPNFVMPVQPSQMLAPPAPFGFPSFPAEGAPPFLGNPYEMARQDGVPDAASEQGSLLGFPPVAPSSMNFPPSYPQPWIAGASGAVQAVGEGYANPSEGQGRGPLYPGDMRTSGNMPLNPPPPPPLPANIMESMQGTSIDPRDGKGILAPQPLPLPPLPPAPHLSQMKRGKFYPGDMGRDGQGFGWQHENRQHENRDSYGSGQD